MLCWRWLCVGSTADLARPACCLGVLRECVVENVSEGKLDVKYRELHILAWEHKSPTVL